VKTKTSFKPGNKHPRWKGGKIRHSRGYIVVLCRKHPFAGKYGYLLEHRLVMEKHLGRYLFPEEQVHHINGVKTDNRIENLVLVKNLSEHMLLFHKRLRNELGQFIKLDLQI
jgi:hypothetical protein